MRFFPESSAVVALCFELKRAHVQRCRASGQVDRCTYAGVQRHCIVLASPGPPVHHAVRVRRHGNKIARRKQRH
jgi:hypothetical protein